MKSNIYLRIISSTLAIGMIARTTVVSAESVSLSSDNINAEFEYIESVIDDYLVANNVALNGAFVSDAYCVIDLETMDTTNNIYFVVQNENVIGLLTVSNINGVYYSSYEVNMSSKIQEIYESKDDIALCCMDEDLLIYENDGDVYSLFSDTTVMNIDERIETNVIKSIYPIESQYGAYSSSSYIVKENLLVPIVTNTTNTANGQGLCWAAAIASRTNYINGTTMVTLDVYNDLNTLYNQIPVGIPTWICRGYDLYDVSCTYTSSMVDATVIYEQIKKDNPIDIALFNDSVGHEVVICGITINRDGSGIYRLVDSNRMIYVDVAVSSETMTADADFVYATSYGYTFTRWTRTFY